MKNNAQSATLHIMKRELKGSRFFVVYGKNAHKVCLHEQNFEILRTLAEAEADSVRFYCCENACAMIKLCLAQIRAKR